MSLKKLALVGGVTASLMAGTAYASVIDRPFFQVLGVVVVWGADNAGTAPVVSDFVLLTNTSGTAGADLIGGNAADTYAVVTGTLDSIAFDAADNTVNGTAAVDPVTGLPAAANFQDTGTSSGVLDAGDTLSAFGIDATTDIDGAIGPASYNSSFFVASNAAFDIYARSSNLQSTGDFATTMGLSDIKLTMSVDAGAAADSGAAGSLQYGAASQDPGNATSIPTGMDLSQMTGANGLKVFDGVQRTAASVGTLAEQSVRFNNVYTLGTTGYDLSQGAGTISADVTYTVFVP